MDNIGDKTESKFRRLSSWLMSRSTGASAKAMVCIFENIQGDKLSYPHDSSDFGRCLAMLDLIPEYRPRLLELRVHPVWKELVMCWGELEALHRNGFHEQLDARIMDIVRDTLKANGNVIRISPVR